MKQKSRTDLRTGKKFFGVGPTKNLKIASNYKNFKENFNAVL